MPIYYLLHGLLLLLLLRFSCSLLMMCLDLNLSSGVCARNSSTTWIKVVDILKYSISSLLSLVCSSLLSKLVDAFYE